nr:unnamed protein product [Callosobruchus analis]
MKDIIYKDYPVEDKDLASKKYVDSAVAKNKRKIDILAEKLSAKATSLESLDLEGRLRYIGVQLADLQKKIEHK